MGMSDKVACKLGEHCVREILEEWDVNSDGICQGCEAVEYYLDRDDKHQVTRLADLTDEDDE